MNKFSKTLIGVAVLLVFGIFAIMMAADQPKEEKEKTACTDTKSCDKCSPELKAQETCPTCGMKINKEFFAEKDHHKIYACNAGCAENIQKDFDKYVKVLKEKGQKPECCSGDHDHEKKAEEKAEGAHNCGGCPMAKGKGCPK